jgi:Trk K+ transport system NAD-binding subunit
VTFNSLFYISEDSEKDIIKSINAKNRDITVTTTKTDTKAFLICSLIGKITFVSSICDSLI